MTKIISTPDPEVLILNTTNVKVAADSHSGSGDFTRLLKGNIQGTKTDQTQPNRQPVKFYFRKPAAVADSTDPSAVLAVSAVPVQTVGVDGLPATGRPKQSRPHDSDSPATATRAKGQPWDVASANKPKISAMPDGMRFATSQPSNFTVQDSDKSGSGFVRRINQPATGQVRPQQGQATPMAARADQPPLSGVRSVNPLLSSPTARFSIHQPGQSGIVAAQKQDLNPAQSPVTPAQHGSDGSSPVVTNLKPVMVNTESIVNRSQVTPANPSAAAGNSTTSVNPATHQTTERSPNQPQVNPGRISPINPSPTGYQPDGLKESVSQSFPVASDPTRTGQNPVTNPVSRTSQAGTPQPGVHPGKPVLQPVVILSAPSVTTTADVHPVVDRLPVPDKGIDPVGRPSGFPLTENSVRHFEAVQATGNATLAAVRAPLIHDEFLSLTSRQTSSREPQADSPATTGHPQTIPKNDSDGADVKQPRFSAQPVAIRLNETLRSAEPHLVEIKILTEKNTPQRGSEKPVSSVPKPQSAMDSSSVPEQAKPSSVTINPGDATVHRNETAESAKSPMSAATDPGKPAPAAEPIAPRSAETVARSKTENTLSVSKPEITLAGADPKARPAMPSIATPAPLQTKPWVPLIQRITELTQLGFQQHTTRLSFEFDGGELGKLGIDFREDGDVRQATIMVESEKTRIEMQKFLPLIQDNLTQKGIDFNLIDIQIKEFTRQRDRGRDQKRGLKNATRIHLKGDMSANRQTIQTAIQYGYNTIELVA